MQVNCTLYDRMASLMAPAQRQLFYPIYEIEQQKSIVHYTPESLYILLRNRCTLYSGIFKKSESRKYKAKNFDYVTFSGLFSERSDKALLKHSGLMAIDFDQIQDTDGLRQALLKDKYFHTELMFVSPSGDGLKWIIPIDLTELSHADYFKAVANYILHSYSIEIDKSGKDVSRACFQPHDKNVYINPKYLQS